MPWKHDRLRKSARGFRWLGLCLTLLWGWSAPGAVATVDASAARESVIGPEDEQMSLLLPVIMTETVFDVTGYLGVYDGTWTNPANAATGPASITIDADLNAGTATLTIDFGGNYLGLGDPPEQTLGGVFDEDGALVQGTSPLFGDYTVNIDARGFIVGVFNDLAGGAIPEMTYTGRVTSERLDADYHVRFADGKTADSLLRTQRTSRGR